MDLLVYKEGVYVNRHREPNSAEATIYHFTLIRKLRCPVIVTLLYSLIPLAGTALFIQQHSWSGLLIIVPGYIFVQWIHWFVVKLTLYSLTEHTRQTWSFRIHPAGFAYLPRQYISLQLFHTVHRHLTFIGLCIILLLIPWIPSELFLCLLSIHVWLVLPRWIYLLRLHREMAQGMIRLDASALFYYHV